MVLTRAMSKVEAVVLPSLAAVVEGSTILTRAARPNWAGAPTMLRRSSNSSRFQPVLEMPVLLPWSWFWAPSWPPRVAKEIWAWVSYRPPSLPAW